MDRQKGRILHCEIEHYVNLFQGVGVTSGLRNTSVGCHSIRSIIYVNSLPLRVHVPLAQSTAVHSLDWEDDLLALPPSH